MPRILFSTFMFFSIWLVSCQKVSSERQEAKNDIHPIDPIAQQIIDRTIAYHGGQMYDSALITFDFRNKHYRRHIKKGLFEYSRQFIAKDGITPIKDILNNQAFHRVQGLDTLQLALPKANAYANSVNSVIYFAELPYRLNDQAVVKAYLGEVKLAGEPYHKIKVTFRKEGGGEDHDDIFIYWIHREHHRMDYLAYKYHTNGGGIRFRKAYNSRRIGGILIQDYINYKPVSDTIALEITDRLFESGALIEVSRIVLENVEVKSI